ncbi:Histidine triad-like protein [Cordyceps fumosorosea ARSEF 2679]|uniref:Histidine triad-like protein n=1 Tax=Cordyceps fumosorosea (strain ARSEF 2679) TaxID=1081104 RepID=A0A167LVH8_CORFA|nr:Histidine triad-like protein [Cordyceps fumosorosea ARSEF 2679]OAA53564.1 Histidine triad-like protein [Cordyceps fumosorosea ARSEF 2679]
MFDPSSAPEDGCPFCEIADHFPPYDPLSPPSDPVPASTTTGSARHAPATFIVLSTPTVVAFLDIMPLSAGHVLVCPRRHRPKLTDATPGEARALGEQVRALSSAVARATGVDDWNVVQNNGAAAAQVVPHLHYHIIPRPEIRASGRLSSSFTMFGRGQREELDDVEGERLAAEIRKCVAEVLREDVETEPKAKL